MTKSIRTRKSSKKTAPAVTTFMATSWVDSYRAQSATLAEEAMIAAALSEDDVIEALSEPKNEPVELSPAQEAVLLEMEANEAADAAIIDHHTQRSSWTESDATEEKPVEFETLLQSFGDEVVTTKVFEIANAVDDRVSFEASKDPDNTTIQRTLKKVRQELVTKRAARIFLATDTATAVINRSIHQGSRYNVYALGKMSDLVRALVDGDPIKNAINNAVIRSLFQCRKAGIAFTGELAKAAASDKIRIDAAVRKHLVRHTVSASTAPTQASSTMSALQILGVVKAEGSSRNPTYVILDTPIARALEAKLAA